MATPLIAKKDIKVYKALVKYDNDRHYYTPYQDYEVPIQCIEEGALFTPEEDKVYVEECASGGFVIEGGMIHTEKLLLSAINHSFMPIIFKCVIPKGTEYYVNDLGGYASKGIIFLDKVPKWKVQLFKKINSLPL